jgi:hypothetical protein
MAESGNLFDGAYAKFPDAPEHYRGQEIGATLGEIFRAAVAHGTSRIEWYSWNARAKASAAKHLRRWSLILFAVGTIAPISVAFLLQITERFGSGSADKIHWNTFDYFKLLPMAEVGYLLLALAGALIIFDQFFDSSGSWIRFRQSEARLQVLLADFRFAWAGLMAKCGGTIDPNQVVAFTTLARDFVTKVEILAEEETSAWAQRFSERLSSFDRNPSLKVTLGGEQQVRGAANGSANGGGSVNGGTPPTGQRGGEPKDEGAPRPAQPQ